MKITTAALTMVWLGIVAIFAGAPMLLSRTSPPQMWLFGSWLVIGGAVLFLAGLFMTLSVNFRSGIRQAPIDPNVDRTELWNNNLPPEMRTSTTRTALGDRSTDGGRPATPSTRHCG